ncbi:DUF4124 domain-containing protein [Thermomonas flagellata]|uniref:DUF4124 domain-containing protein n=1 Tax=Thermomonas flagellata TaxID=2888524 RepID=UPI001F038EC1|nr:DUF4124 domain-containing protein [Thermomonas flagellata]
MTALRRLALTAAVALAALPALAAAQTTVYQWKDAQGVTHYADSPPAGVHATRTLAERAPAPSPAASTTPAAGGEARAAAAGAGGPSKQCLDARANLKRLQGNEPIGLDTTGDGKPDRNLTAEERAQQRTLNEAAVKAYCGGR